ncbi:MAG: potassium transporter TrkG, partial [Acidimicrobiia bacterium]
MPHSAAITARSLPRTLAYVIGSAITAIGASMVLAAAVSAAYQEWATVIDILTAAGVTIGTGLVLWRILGRPSPIGVKEGFATVGLAWFALSAFGALPYLFTDSIGNITDAFFETASGFTTTGSSILADPGELSHGIGVWRALTQWIGGMGVIVLSVAILPLLGTGGVQLARAESPGHTPDRLTPRFQETAKRLWLLYVGFTLAEVLLLVAADMDLYEAVTHSFSTLSTGGFGLEPNSVAGFSPYVQW